MEQSNKNSPRADENLESRSRDFLQGAPVGSRAREDLREEGAGPRPGQPSAAAEVAGREPGTSEGLSASDVDRRAELATYIEGSVFPAEKSALIESASDMQAPGPVINLLKSLPDGQQFEHFQEVWDSVSS